MQVNVMLCTHVVYTCMLVYIITQHIHTHTYMYIYIHVFISISNIHISLSIYTQDPHLYLYLIAIAIAISISISTSMSISISIPISMTAADAKTCARSLPADPCRGSRQRRGLGATMAAMPLIHLPGLFGLATAF